jgi:hypothetical protein
MCASIAVHHLTGDVEYPKDFDKILPTPAFRFALDLPPILFRLISSMTNCCEDRGEMTIYERKDHY